MRRRKSPMDIKKRTKAEKGKLFNGSYREIYRSNFVKDLLQNQWDDDDNGADTRNSPCGCTVKLPRLWATLWCCHSHTHQPEPHAQTQRERHHLFESWGFGERTGEAVLKPTAALGCNGLIWSPLYWEKNKCFFLVSFSGFKRERGFANNGMVIWWKFKEQFDSHTVSLIMFLTRNNPFPKFISKC